MTDYEKLKKLYDEIDNLIYRVSSSSPDFITWKTKVQRFLIKKYGSDSREFKEFDSTHFEPLIYFDDMGEANSIEVCADGLKATKATFIVYLDEIKNEEDTCNIQKVSNPSIGSKKISQKNKDFSKVFIVHGHDGEMRESVAHLMDKQGIVPIVLSDEANKGATIIEKIENNSDVGAAICIFTPDDVGKAKSDKDNHDRARQNVVLETGYFMGKLGRDRIIIFSTKDLELPSDLQGIVYMDSNWRLEMLKELSAMGYDVDLNKLLK